MPVAEEYAVRAFSRASSSRSLLTGTCPLFACSLRHETRVRNDIVMIFIRWQAIPDGRLPSELVSNVVCDITSISQSTQEQPTTEEKMDCVITHTNLSKITYTEIPGKFQGTAGEAEGGSSQVSERKFSF